MASWEEVEKLAPELAPLVQGRFDAHGLGLLATLRRDGFPRISGVEPLFSGELWLGMMHRSKKAADLIRDPRLCFHSATEDKNVTHGDAKLWGRGLEVTDEDVITEFRKAFAAHTGMDVPPGAMHLFRVDVTEMSLVRPAGDHLLIDSWREGEPVKQTRRY